jgi:hypothetical protein
VTGYGIPYVLRPEPPMSVSGAWVYPRASLDEIVLLVLPRPTIA